MTSSTGQRAERGDVRDVRTERRRRSRPARRRSAPPTTAIVVGARAISRELDLEPRRVDAAADRSRPSPSSSRRRRRAGSPATLRPRARCATHAGVDRRVDRARGSSTSQAASPARQDADGYIGVTAPRGLERRQQLLVDVVEAAVRHDDDEVAVLASARDGPDDVVDLRDVARVLAAAACRSATSCSADSRWSSGSVDRKTAGRMTRSAAAKARAKSSWNTRRHDVAERGSKIAQMRRSGIRRADAGERLARSPSDDARSRRRPRRRAPCRAAACRRRTPLKRAQPPRHRVGAQPDGGADRDRRQRVPDVVGAEQRHLEHARRLALRGAG